jgi:hypothetical protein
MLGERDSALRAALQAALPSADLADALCARCIDHGVGIDRLEASVRRMPGGGLFGRRVMIERAPAELLAEVTQILGYRIPAAALGLLEAARASGLPLIIGWDARTSGPVWLKLYLNASDASEPLRNRWLSASTWPEVAGLADVAHLLALNFHAEAIEKKAYVQYGDSVLSAVRFGQTATDLARGARELGLDAGAVACFRLEDGKAPRPRAWFVALRDTEAASVFLARLPDWNASAVDGALPFARGQCRSVGIGLDPEFDGAWTAYFKAFGCEVPLYDLEPAATFRSGDFEVSIFVAPTAYVERAYFRSRHSALWYITPAAVPPHDVIEKLMDWTATRLVEIEEKSGRFAEELGAPPAPWTRVR